MSDCRALIGAPAADRALIGAPEEDRALIGAPADFYSLANRIAEFILSSNQIPTLLSAILRLFFAPGKKFAPPALIKIYTQ